MIRKHSRPGVQIKYTLGSLQEKCCSVISINCERFPDYMLEELSLPCLYTLVQHLSMFDLLRLEQLLERRGLDPKNVMYSLHRKIFQSRETYPIKTTTCPHLLTLFPYDGLDWGLSRLLFRRTIAVLVEEYNNCSDEECRSFQSDTQEHLVRRNECLMEMFCPPNGCWEMEVKAKLSRLYMMVENLTVMAARKIIFLTINLKVLKFLLDKRFESVLHSLYESVVFVTILLKNSPLLLDFLKKMRENGKMFQRVCVYGIKMNDLFFLDEILSLCSGVAEYGTTTQGHKEKEALRQTMTDDERNEFDPRIPLGHLMPIAQSSSDSLPGFDLMDDAVLFGTPCPPSRFDSTTGMLKADFRFTNLVRIECYSMVLNHHLKSWLALQELHIGVPSLHPKTVRCLCYLLQRPQFRCFTLSSTSVGSSVIEDLLCAAASRRSSTPLEKFIFVSVQEILESFHDLLITDQLITKSQKEIADFVQANESPKLAQFQGFRGTRLLEVTQCTLVARTEVMVGQFVLKDLALESLCISNSISRVMVQSTLKSLASTGRQLTRLILENWHILKDVSTDALTSLLSSVTLSLQSLSLRGCLTIDPAIMFKDIIEAVAACRNLKHIDISENKLGNDGVTFVARILAETSVNELSLRRNEMTKANICSILKSSAEIMKRRRPLDLLDLRGNSFVEDDRNEQKVLLGGLARHVLVGPNY